MKRRWWISGGLLAGILIVATAVGLRLSVMTEPFSFLDGRKPVITDTTPGSDTDHLASTYSFKADFEKLCEQADSELTANGWKAVFKGANSCTWDWHGPTPSAPRWHSGYAISENM